MPKSEETFFLLTLIKSDRQLWLIESCRMIGSDIETIDIIDKKPTFKKGGVLPSAPITREKSRAIYDKQIKNCAKGNVICFACSNFFISIVLLFGFINPFRQIVYVKQFFKIRYILSLEYFINC